MSEQRKLIRQEIGHAFCPAPIAMQHQACGGHVTIKVDHRWSLKRHPRNLFARSGPGAIVRLVDPLLGFVDVFYKKIAGLRRIASKVKIQDDLRGMSKRAKEVTFIDNAP